MGGRRVNNNSDDGDAGKTCNLPSGEKNQAGSLFSVSATRKRSTSIRRASLDYPGLKSKTHTCPPVAGRSGVRQHAVSYKVQPEWVELKEHFKKKREKTTTACLRVTRGL